MNRNKLAAIAAGTVVGLVGGTLGIELVADHNRDQRDHQTEQRYQVESDRLQEQAVAIGERALAAQKRLASDELNGKRVPVEVEVRPWVIDSSDLLVTFERQLPAETDGTSKYLSGSVVFQDATIAELETGKVEANDVTDVSWSSTTTCEPSSTSIMLCPNEDTTFLFKSDDGLWYRDTYSHKKPVPESVLGLLLDPKPHVS